MSLHYKGSRTEIVILILCNTVPRKISKSNIKWIWQIQKGLKSLWNCLFHHWQTFGDFISILWASTLQNLCSSLSNSGLYILCAAVELFCHTSHRLEVGMLLMKCWWSRQGITKDCSYSHTKGWIILRKKIRGRTKNLIGQQENRNNFHVVGKFWGGLSHFNFSLHTEVTIE